MPPIQRVYISAGSNLGNRKANLEYALQSLTKRGVVPTEMSSYFETEPVGFFEQPWFLNIAIKLETRLAPYELLDLCQEVENSYGRVRNLTKGPRTLDLDILLYDDIVVNQLRLVIPHPRMSERKFVLVPLAQIAPEVLHPVLKKTIRSLLEACSDPSVIRPYVEDGF